MKAYVEMWWSASVPYRRQEAGYTLTNVLNNKGTRCDVFSSFQSLAFVASVKHPGESRVSQRFNADK